MFRNAIFMTLPLLLLFFMLAEAGTEPHRVGGRCEYASYSGEAKITSVVEKDGDRFEVKFRFIPRTPIKERPLLAEHREYLVLINNTIYPGREFVKLNGIVTDKLFDCDVKVIVKGSCTPILFEFPSMISGN